MTKATLTATLLTNGESVILRASTIEHLIAAYERERDERGLGASSFGPAIVRDAEGTEVARISYNGRCWPAGEWYPGQTPLALRDAANARAYLEA